MKVVRLEHTSAPRRRGRPPSFEFTQEMADKICELMINGEDLGTICRREDMPNRVCVDRWRVQRPDFHEQLARARECLAHAEFDRIKELADACTEQNYNSTRVKLLAYQWRIARLAPKMFGDKTTIEATANISAAYTRTLDVSGLDLSEMLALEKALMKTMEYQG